MLVHLVDALPLDGSDPVTNYRTIRHELELYSPELARRPELLVITKLDVTGSAEAMQQISHELCREPMAISAVTGQGIPALIRRISELLEQLPPEEPAKVSTPIAVAAGA